MLIHQIHSQYLGTNNRAWSSYENEFQTRYRMYYSSSSIGSWTNIGNITTWSRTATQMRSLIPKAYDGTTVYLQMKRYSPSPDWYSSNTAQIGITMYYRPRVGVSTNNITYRQNSSNGTSINKGQIVKNDNSLTHIYVSWSYDTTAVNAGYTQGYRIRVYNKDNTSVKTYYTDNKYYSIPKADIPKMQNTYIDITPYFKNDTTDTSNYWYYTGTISKASFVYLISTLATPVITYPVNNSNWINNKFRICFQLPIDPDKGNETETYHYDDVEVMINGNFTIRMKDSAQHTTTGTNLIATECYSALQSNLTYQRKLVINPSIATGFPNATSYTIKVRIKKKYGETTLFSMWSDWSNAVKVTITKPVYSVNKGDLILAKHYNDTLSLVNRIRNTYRS